MILAASQFWWHLSRASGIVSWALAASAVLWGLALSTRALGSRPRAPWLLDLHRFLGGLTIVFVAVHLVGLWADSYVTFGLAELFVPMASPWRPDAVAWGVVALYLLLAVEVTSLLMRRIPKRLWHSVHLLSYGVFAAGTIHLFTAGTDATNPALRWAAAVTVAATVFFLVYRLVGPGRHAGARSRRSEVSVV
jgi:DMSO/TMAO reductase YedYZ heme-binding membrane subunit